MENDGTLLVNLPESSQVMGNGQRGDDSRQGFSIGIPSGWMMRKVSH